MGRGRAKAKQIKVARKLKYSTPATDLSALERELRGRQRDTVDDAFADDFDDESEEDDDPYGSQVDDHDDYGSWAADGRR